MATTAQIRRMAATFSLMLNAGTEGERQSAANAMKNQMHRLGRDTSKIEDLVDVLRVGFQGKPDGSEERSPDSFAFKKRNQTINQVKEFSKEQLAKHEGISQPELIRVLMRNVVAHEKHLSNLEIASVKGMLNRRPLRIHDDEWDMVFDILGKVGLSRYVPDREDIHEEI